jgi:hypothetical protein
MKKPVITRIRIILAYPGLYRGIVMRGAKMVSSTGNMRDRAACLRLAEILDCVYKAAERAVAL